MTKQRDGRELSLKFLFCQEFVQDIDASLSPREKLTKFQYSFKAQPEVWNFTWGIVENFYAHQEKIDNLIKEHLTSWNFDRLPATDKNLLRIAIVEMLYTDTPAKVALNEAIELCKKYSSLESVPFINGILDTILKKNDLES